ncbi:MAG: hypothetical protein HZC13_02760 [Nitrospirae bacterium]|nr:hypothetical protein [Nitrospirota bacterium]MBI5097321.1 hypothetical protein [Nitrospirota bacterium]
MIAKDEIVKKNLDLLNEFMKYAFDHPDVIDNIPSEAELVILPTDDPELYNENKKTVDSLLKKGKKVVIVEFEKPKTILPKIELLSA